MPRNVRQAFSGLDPIKGFANKLRQWNSASLYNTNIYRGQLSKGHQKNIFTTKIISNNNFFIV
jgi:hypothetical protein